MISERRLAAIVLGNVVDYDRLLQVDRAGTIAALEAHRDDLVLPAIAAFRARLIDMPGDAMVIEFASAVDAVTCAVTIQRKMIERNAAVPEASRLWLRLGIDLGDIAIDDDGVSGDGVTIASGLEGRCEAGGICLSQSVQDQVRGKLHLPFVAAGEFDFPGIDHPVSGFRLAPDRIATLADVALPAARAPAPKAQVRIGIGALLNDTYRIETPIGSGGMGEIFKGYEIHSGGVVAIKLVRFDMIGNKTALSLFQREALVLKDIHHDAIVGYYSFSFDPTLQRHYLAMEFVDGVSLSDIAKQGPLPVEAVMALRRRVASGLALAHKRGIVHRDMSPDNIIVPSNDFERAKIIDFGIARAKDLGTGTIIGDGFAGKYNYVSPEQLGLFGADVTAASDIYSLGLVLAEASLGRPIDMSGSQADVIEKRRIVPDLSGIDPRLRPLLERMLQPQPEHRPGSMEEIADWSDRAPAADAARRPTPDGPTTKPRAQPLPPPRPRRHIERWIIGGTLGMALLWGIGLVAYMAVPPPRKAPQTDEALPPVSPPSTPPEPLPQTAAPTSLPPTSLPPTAPPEQQPQPPTEPKAPPLSPSASDVIKAYIKGFDGGGCVYLQPVRITSTSAAINGLAQSRDAFSSFAKGFTDALHFEPDLVGTRVWSHQCPAVDFMRQVQSGDGVAPSLFLKSTRIGAGQSMAGEIQGVAPGQSITLLQVQEDGTVHNVSSAIKRDGDAVSFDIKSTRSVAGGPFPQLLLALASPKPLSAAEVPELGPAEQVFRAIVDESARGQYSIGADAKAYLAGG